MSAAAPAVAGDGAAWRGRVLLAAIVALAVALRVWHIGHGLPDFLEEALPFRLAIEMWGWNTGRPDWNPHEFHYPSLTIYLQFLVQQAGFAIGHLTGRTPGASDWLLSYLIHPSPMVIAGRLLQVGFDLATVVGAARLGERLRPGAGLVAALLVACSPALIRTSRAIYTDTTSGALAVWSLERMLAWRERGGPGRLATAALLAGLAAGAKYTAAILLAPLAWVAWERLGTRGTWAWLAAAALAGAAFAITTPFALFDSASFARDFAFEQLHATQGHFGSFERTGLAFHAMNLARSLGWPGMGLLAFSLVATAAAPRRRASTTTLWIALLLFGIPIALARIAAERYLVPIIPLAAVLAAAAALELAARAPGAPRRWVSAALIAALVLPPLVAGIGTAAEQEGSTQIAARRWCEAHLGPDALMVQESYGVVLPTATRRLDVQSGPVYARAAAETRRRFDALRLYRVVDLPLAVAGRCVNAVSPAEGSPVELEIFPHVVDFNRVFYDPRLFAAADYVLTSRAVRGRFEADPARYAIEGELYRRLDRSAEVAAAFRPRRPDDGPAITIYRIGPPARAALDSAAALDPLWWAGMIPADYRRRATALLDPALPPGDSALATALRDPSGRPTPWVSSLIPIYAAHVHAFTSSMALELVGLGRLDAAQRFARATFDLAPEDVEACLVLATCAERRGRWAEARAVVERGLAAHPASEAPPGLLAELAETLARTGDAAGARRALERVIAGVDRGSALDVAARARLDSLRIRGH